MSINYARAAATDFAAMRAAFARQWIANDPQMRASLDAEIAKLTKTLTDDLKIAVQRSQSTRAERAAAQVREAVAAWRTARERLLDGTKLDVSWEVLDNYAAKVDEQIDLLINYTAGDGFIYRQTARATVARDIQLNILGTALALALSAMVAWALARRIVGPLGAASNIAQKIAAGKLDVVVPDGTNDEVGKLLSSMRTMRNNIKDMMDRGRAAPLGAGAARRRAAIVAGRRHRRRCQQLGGVGERQGGGPARRSAGLAAARNSARSARADAAARLGSS
jgi:HAMP domain-containing protein